MTATRIGIASAVIIGLMAAALFAVAPSTSTDASAESLHNYYLTPKSPHEGVQPYVFDPLKDAKFALQDDPLTQLWKVRSVNFMKDHTNNTVSPPENWIMNRRASFYAGAGTEPTLDVEAHFVFREAWMRRGWVSNAAAQFGNRALPSTGVPYICVRKDNGEFPGEGERIPLSMEFRMYLGERDLDNDGNAEHGLGFERPPVGISSFSSGAILLTQGSTKLFDVFAYRDQGAILDATTGHYGGGPYGGYMDQGGHAKWGPSGEMGYSGGAEKTLLTVEALNLTNFNMYVEAQANAWALWPSEGGVGEVRGDFKESYAHAYVDPYVFVDPNSTMAADYEIRIMDWDGRFVPTIRNDLITVETPPESVHVTVPNADSSFGGGSYAIYRENEPGLTGATVSFVIEVSGGIPEGATLEITHGGYGPADPAGTYALDRSGASLGFGPYFMDSVNGHSARYSMTVRTASGALLDYAELHIMVEDNEPPVIHGDVEAVTFELDNWTGLFTIEAAKLVARFGLTATDNGGWVTEITGGGAAQGSYESFMQKRPVGTGEWALSVRDSAGNQGEVTFPVTITDTTPPWFEVWAPDTTISVPEGVTVAGATLSYRARDLDLQAGPPTFELRGPNGVLVPPLFPPIPHQSTIRAVYRVLAPLGANEYTCTATDAHGNKGSYVTTVTVETVQEPYFTCSQVVADNEPGECFAFVDFAVTPSSRWSGILGEKKIVYTADGGEVVSGDAFPVGTTSVTAKGWSMNILDAWGVVTDATCTFSILVLDAEAPEIVGSTVVELASDSGTGDVTLGLENLGLQITDNCDLVPSYVVDPLVVSPGTTQVTVTAWDGAGNYSAAHTLQVTVLNRSLECRLKRPLECLVDNRINPGRTVPVKLGVVEDNVAVSGATVTIHEIQQVGGDGSPIANEVIDDAGTANDDGDIFRVDAGNDCYVYNLSTKTWDDTSGARFRVTVKISKDGYADSFCEFYLVNK